MTKEVQRFLQIFREEGILRGKFILASGQESSFYFDGRMVTLSPEGAYLLGRTIFDLIKNLNVDAVGGMAIGADPIVTSVALISYVEKKPVSAFIVRGAGKDHGTQKLIEGPLKPGFRVVIVDDVITSGRSVLRSIEAAESYDCKVVKVVVILDRKAGGSEEIIKRGYDFQSLLLADESGDVSIALH